MCGSLNVKAIPSILFMHHLILLRLFFPSNISNLIKFILTVRARRKCVSVNSINFMFFLPKQLSMVEVTSFLSFLFAFLQVLVSIINKDEVSLEAVNNDVVAFKGKTMQIQARWPDTNFGPDVDRHIFFELEQLHVTTCDEFCFERVLLTFQSFS